MKLIFTRIVLIGMLNGMAYGDPDKIATNSCQTSIILKLTNVFETSHQEFQFDPCVQLSDGHGYSAGIVQFTTGTGSAEQVIQFYSDRVHPNEFTVMNATLEAITLQLKAGASGDASGLVSSVAGLDGYCDAWSKASQRPEFRDAQIAMLAKMYFIPSQKAATDAGLSYAVSIGQIYDSTIQLGAQGTHELIQMVTARRGTPGPQNELEWISEFLDDREKKLIAMGGAYAPTVTRIKSYQFLVKNNDPNFQAMPVHGLDNDGKPMNVDCNSEITIPGMNDGIPGGLGLGKPGNSSIFYGAAMAVESESILMVWWLSFVGISIWCFL